MAIASGAYKKALEGNQQPKEVLVKIDRVTKQFDETLAVDTVSLTINKGEIFALLGGSGSGKSTLLRMLAGFERPTEGRIFLDGQDITDLPPYERPINMMFQSYALFPHMSVAQNIAFGLKQDGLPKAEIDERVAEMLKLVHMTQYAKRKEEAMTMAQRIAIMHLGCIEQIGSPMDIYETPASRLVCEFIGNVNLFDGVLVEDVQDHAVIACPQLENPIYIGHGISTRAEDKRITYALRPEKVMISAQKPDNLEHAGHNWAQGTVYDIAYLGGHSVYYIKLASGMIVQAFMANAERHVARPTWDQSVYISWYDDSGVVLQS